MLRELSHRVILLRPKQVTLGSLMLACRGSDAAWFGREATGRVF